MRLETRHWLQGAAVAVFALLAAAWAEAQGLPRWMAADRVQRDLDASAALRAGEVDDPVALLQPLAEAGSPLAALQLGNAHCMGPEAVEFGALFGMPERDPFWCAVWLGLAVEIDRRLARAQGYDESARYMMEQLEAGDPMAAYHAELIIETWRPGRPIRRLWP